MFLVLVTHEQELFFSMHFTVLSLLAQFHQRWLVYWSWSYVHPIQIKCKICHANSKLIQGIFHKPYNKF